MHKVTVEFFIDSDESEGDVMWTLFQQVACMAENFSEIKKIRLPDSPEPDITGYVEFK